jgi:putative protease
MNQLELLAPARDLQIGIAAIDCGADAVYIAGPRFGARQAAGNEIEDIQKLCEYAHRFGARIFVTLNTILYDEELEQAWEQMLAMQEAGVDALIVQDMAIVSMAMDRGYSIPLHASTQCAIRTPEQAAFLEKVGFSRLVLERELSLEQIKAIRAAVSCELEFFVHGALCVCYSGQCYLSEHIAGRSANRGACIQACRSKYDLVDGSGKVLVKDKAVLSLKDYNLRNRIEELADAGICSFKIEGRLKNASYVRNVVRDYSMALDELIARRPYVRGSFGTVTGGFIPNTDKTFNRGYTELFLDGNKGRWAAMDAAKSMGEEIGSVASLNRDKSCVTLNLKDRQTILNNGDGFSFVAADGNVCGFRGDVCSGTTIRCKSTPELFSGARIYRNIDTAFEKEMDRKPCVREIKVGVKMSFYGGQGHADALSEDGRYVRAVFETGGQAADNQERMQGMIASQIGKSVGHYRFEVKEIQSDGVLPFMAASALNGVRRSLAEELDKMVCNKRDILHKTPDKESCENIAYMKDASYRFNISNKLAELLYSDTGVKSIEKAYELEHQAHAELMRTKYCVRHELGLCPKQQRGKKASNPEASTASPLYILNNGQRFTLAFDCRNCEMIVTA